MNDTKTNMTTPDLNDFERKYTLVKNPNPHCEGSPSDCLFETYSPDIDFVQSQAPRQVWTLTEEEGTQYITAGFHLANRLGFFVTREEWADPEECYLYTSDGDTDETSQAQ